MAGKFYQVMRISSFVSHALAWAVYLVVSFGFVVWPALRDGYGEDLKVLATVFAPVAISGLGWLTVLTQGRRATGKPVPRTVAVFLAVFCVLAIFTVALIYLPILVKLVIGIMLVLTWLFWRWMSDGRDGLYCWGLRQSCFWGSAY